MHLRLFAACTVAAALVVVGAAQDTAAVPVPGAPGAMAAAAVDTPTYARDVAPILYRECAACHRSGGIAPYSVMDPAAAQARATLIAAYTRTRRMPPWLPSGKVEFEGERRLTEEEIATIGAWAAAGAPLGDTTQLPPAPEFPDGWQLGRPDLVVEMPEAFHLPANGDEVFRNFVLPVPFEGLRWVSAVELRVDNTRVVHHTMLMMDQGRSARQADAADTLQGFDGMLLPGTVTMPPGFLLGWTPGALPGREQEGLAWPLRGGTDLVFQMHLRPTAQPESVRARIGFHFTDTPPEVMPAVVKLSSEVIDIPPGDSAYAITDAFRLPIDVDLLAIYPHAHYLGKRIEATAELPDGSTRWLLDIPDWDFNWQDAYRYAERISLPAGTVLRMQIVYDNSTANPRNPSNPPRRVVYGPRSTDEMGDVYFHVLPKDQGEMPVLARALQENAWEINVEGAEQLLRLNPDSVEALSRLGSLYLQGGKLQDAVPLYRRAIELAPQDGNLHFNLGLVLERLEGPEAAIPHYQEAAHLIPEHAEAHYRLAGMLLATGRLADALPHAREAARLMPDRSGVLVTLAWSLLGNADADPALAQEAVLTAGRAAGMTQYTDIPALIALAAGYATVGNLDRAVDAADRALAVARAVGDSTAISEMQSLVASYRSRMPGPGTP